MMPWRLLSLLFTCALFPSAWAQSTQTLEAVRLHAPDARPKVRAELAECQTARCPTLAQLRLLAGYLALAEGEPNDALRMLTVGRAPSRLEAHHAYYRGQAFFYARKWKEALQAFESARRLAPESLRPRAAGRLGEVALKLRDFARAREAFDDALRSLEVPELYWQRALARQALGDVNGALADARAVALKSPLHPDGERALAWLSKAGAEHRLTLDERLTRCAAFLEANLPNRALSELDTAESDGLLGSTALATRHALVKSSTLFALGRTNEAEQALATALTGPPAVASEALLTRARRAMRRDDNLQARALMQQVVETYPQEAAAEEASFFVGWLDLRAVRFPEAAASFAAFAQRFPRTRRADEGMWYQAFAQLKAGQASAAQGTLDALVSLFPRSPLVPQARYWSVRARQEGGAPSGELIARYEEVGRTYPGSFYALLAASRLAELGKPFPLSLPRWTEPVRIKVPPELGIAEALAHAGLYPDLAWELERVGRTARTTQKALELGQTLAAWGEHGAAYQLAARKLWGEAFTAKNGAALALLYPRAFRRAVEVSAQKEQVDPFFVWAIMRRESTFRPEVMSAADARGLMQLIPPTATRIAEQLGEPPPPKDALFSPELNIRYASWYLGQLFTRFGHPALVAGAYNAGPPRAVQWAKRDPPPPLDLFVEEIPFKETRGYIKQVLADHLIYHALYGDPSRVPSPALTVPVPGPGVEF